jgi:hypothetical protein
MERCTIVTILCVELNLFTAFLFLPFAIRLLSQYQNNVYPSSALWIKFLIHLMWLLFHSNKCSRAFLSATITPISSSGYQNNYGLPGNTRGLQGLLQWRRLLLLQSGALAIGISQSSRQYWGAVGSSSRASRNMRVLQLTGIFLQK